MKKETRTGLLVTLAVLAVWVYIEVEPVLSQNGGAGFFNQFQQQQQPVQQNWNGNSPQLLPQNYMQDNMRSPGFSQGVSSMPNNMLGAPRGGGVIGAPANQFGSMPRQMPMQQQQPFVNQMPAAMPPQNQGFKGMMQRMFGNSNPNRAMEQPRQFNQLPNQGFAPGNNVGAMNQAISAVRQELSIAANSASQAEAYRSEALSVRDRGAKRRAAQESRYYASQARAAASRAVSKSQGIPQALSIVNQVRAQASRAQSAADSASSAASGW